MPSKLKRIAESTFAELEPVEPKHFSGTEVGAEMFHTAMLH
jgi:hypothetical protein